MVQYQLKLRKTKAIEHKLNEWLWILTGVWNWASRKIELNAKDGIYFSKFDISNGLPGTSIKLGIPSHTIQATLANVYQSWQRCFKKISKKPRLKGCARKLNSIPFPDPIKSPINNRISIPGLGKIKFHKQKMPQGKIKCGRLIKKASGWYLCVFIDTQRKNIKRRSTGTIGIDPGFNNLLTLSDGTKINHPRELEKSAKRLAQAQRGGNKKLVARLHERIANRKKDRNHKLSTDLVSAFNEIYFSKDNIRGIANKFGKSVNSSNHFQFRQMLKYKSLASGTKYVEVDSKFSTRICHACLAVTGPAGLAELKVRNWQCTTCGSQNDRDVNAAINTVNFGTGRVPEGAVLMIGSFENVIIK